MERLFQEYGEIAEFRMVYIREAHAADSNWSVDYAREKGITRHDSYEERCTTADMLLNDKSLTIPCLIDDMEDSVNRKYRASPDRIFIVRTDGTLAVAADEGPFGFKPALDATGRWLEEFRRSGIEPTIAPPAPERVISGFMLPEDVDPRLLVGEWSILMKMPGGELAGTLNIAVEEGRIVPELVLNRRTMPVQELEFDGRSLNFWFEFDGRSRTLEFTGAVDGASLRGTVGGAVDTSGRRQRIGD